MTQEPQRFDAVVIGTGFGGAVTACRLVQAGLRVCILERGRRFEADDVPVYRPAFEGAEPDGGSDPDPSRLAWALGGGVWDLCDLGDVVVAQAAGYGGGSLIYANVHLRAPADVFERWPAVHRELDAYCDLAAFMLQAEPMPEEILPRKTRQLRRAAGACRSAGGSPVFSFFRPPLAVRFSAGRPAGGEANRWGRQRGACDLSGDCCFGCSSGARNTLDTNYLASVEDAADSQGRPLADVRTQAEVVAICSSAREGHPGYEVEYVDRCFERLEVRERVFARNVFLCAGAVNTTALLLAARESGALRPAGKGLGERFYTNADAPAVIFDCEELQEPDRGPTIGGALLHRSGSDWLLIEDGGLPGALEPLLGLYRSPLLAARNRFRESRRDARRSEAGEPLPQRLAFAPLPLGGASGILAQLERSSRTPRHSLAHVLGAELHRLAGGGDVRGGGEPRWGLPRQLLCALGSGRNELAAALSTAAEPLVEKFLSRLAGSLGRDGPMKPLFDGLAGAGLGGEGKLALELEFLRMVVQQVWGSQASLIHDLVSFALDELIPDSDALLDQVSNALRWALDYRLDDGHTAILLSMGRDRAPGTLALDSSGKLVASLPSRLESPEALLQERLLRDLAALGFEGELRTNPAWTLVDRRFTVHAQGGCAMGEGPETGVTAASGEVFGCPGLFVMDAAAFPTPVGVNPSATIAAVAERKVEAFVRTLPGREGWAAPELDEARRWADLRRADLDPLGDPHRLGPHAAPSSCPIGIEFEERMTGFHAAAGERAPGFRDAERSGIERSAPLEIRLAAVVDDLSGFLQRAERAERALARGGGAEAADPPEIAVTGTICARDLPGAADGEGTFSVLDGSRITLFSSGGRAAAAAPAARRMEYRLRFEAEGRPWRLEGHKLLRDAPGLDAFEDATTLFFDLFDGDTRVRRGIARLPTSVLFGTQLPSFRATHTEDPLRQTWALTAFGNFFLGRLAQIYAPELGGLAPILAKAVRRTHV